jgi:hypothetical protein
MGDERPRGSADKARPARDRTAPIFLKKTPLGRRLGRVAGTRPDDAAIAAGSSVAALLVSRP